MNIGDYLLATIERIARKAILARETLCLTGEVTAVKPLKIRVKNYELGEENLVLDVRCTEQWIKIPKDGANKHYHEINDSTEETSETGSFAGTIGGAPATGNITLGPHKHAIKINTEEALPEICLWRELRVGDKVRIIRLEGGAIHWVTGRIEEKMANDSDRDGGG
jgi:hypothetical protein